MADFVANFELEQNNFDADFELENVQFDAVFQINPAGAAWGTITGRIEEQTDLQEALDSKANLTDLPTVNNGVLTIQANGTNIATFSANQSGNTTANITIPDSATWGNITGELSAQTDLQNELDNKADLSDLPTVNNATITIQKNGSTVESFTLNQATNETVNITVPTTASDVGALSNSTNYGASIDLSLNTTDYKLTLTLKDQNGNTLNSKVVDFPIESVVVNGRYDSTNKKIVLTLQNGTTIDIPVGDLVAGLQSEITSTNKLDADLVDDSNSVNKFVTASEKTTWNNKQDALVSGTNIKTINNESILGSGNIDIQGGGTVDQTFNPTSTNAQSGVAINGAGFATQQWTLEQASGLMVSLQTWVQEQDYATETWVTEQASSLATSLQTWVNNQGFISGITSSDVTTALGYTPYNSTNPNGYITSADLPTNHVTTDTAQNISGRKTFLGEKAIYFKQSATTNKLGFTLYNPSDTELGAFEYRPNTINGGALLNVNVPYSSTSYVGFRYWGTAVNVIAPKVATAGNYYIPTHITDGTNTVTASNNGTVNISTLLPDVSNFVTNSSLATTLSSYATQQWVIEQASALATDLQTWVTNQGYTSNVGTVTSVNNTQPDANGNVTISTGGTVDQTYDGTSANAQSGIAIAGAKFVQNTATATNSLTILGTTNNKNYSVLIGAGTTAGSEYNTVIGNTATGNGTYATALGYYARANGQYTTAIGNNSYANYQDVTAIGHSSQATAAGTLAVGSNSKATAQRATSIGYSSQATQYQATSLGYEAKATANSALQIGTGTNSTANTLQVGTYTLLDTSTGLIPDARISSNIARTSDLSGYVQASNGNMTFANAGTEGDILYTNSTTGEFYGVVIGQSSTYGTGVTIGAGNSLAQNGYMLNLSLNGFAVIDASNMGTALLTVSNNNLAVNGSEVALQSDLSSLANTDLSNLSATGKEVIDGQWVYTNEIILDGASIKNSSGTPLPKTVTLPDDNHEYEVMFRGRVTTGTTSGNYIRLQIAPAENGTMYGSTVFVCSARTRSASAVEAQGTVIVPNMKYGTNNLLIIRDANFNGTADLNVIAYRRIGTNT